MKTKITKVTEAILKGKNIRQAIMIESLTTSKDEAKKIWEEICEGVKRVQKIIDADKTPIVIKGDSGRWKGTVSDLYLSYTEDFEDAMEEGFGSMYVTIMSPAEDEVSPSSAIEISLEDTWNKIVELCKKEINYPILDVDAADGECSIIYDIIDENDWFTD